VKENGKEGGRELDGIGGKEEGEGPSSLIAEPDGVGRGHAVHPLEALALRAVSDAVLLRQLLVLDEQREGGGQGRGGGQLKTHDLLLFLLERFLPMGSRISSTRSTPTSGSIGTSKMTISSSLTL